MTEKQIEKRYEYLVRKRKKINNDIEEFKKSIVGICHHPKKYIHKYLDERDNGYGVWYGVEVRTCMICGKNV